MFDVTSGPEDRFSLQLNEFLLSTRADRRPAIARPLLQILHFVRPYVVSILVGSLVCFITENQCDPLVSLDAQGLSADCQQPTWGVDTDSNNVADFRIFMLTRFSMQHDSGGIPYLQISGPKKLLRFPKKYVAQQSQLRHR